VCLLPYYFTFRHQNLDRRYLEGVAPHFQAEAALARPRKVAVFSDTVYQTNGVALSLRKMLQASRASGRKMLLITCSDRPGWNGDGIRDFPALTSRPMPYYPELSLSIPPLLDMLEYCEREGVTAIQVSTPGPVGLAGLLIARILNLPCIGFYHTNLPHLVRDLTGDQTLEGLTKKFTAWFYDRMDAVFGSSRQSLDDLAKIGVDPSRLKLAPRGIDLETFHPMWRDESIWRDFGVDGERKLLYVGRMSREKNLDILANGFKQMAPRTRGVRLIMVGDGPYRADLEKTLTGFPVSFTGELHGETLSKVYAS
jgi:glycosyltransferase involved in cell wall biosynthesis